MKIALDAGQLAALKAYLKEAEDCEALSEKEYILDLYDLETPLSIDLIFEKDGIDVEGAAELLFDEEMDGWYIGERLENPDDVVRGLNAAGALGA